MTAPLKECSNLCEFCRKCYSDAKKLRAHSKRCKMLKSGRNQNMRLGDDDDDDAHCQQRQQESNNLMCFSDDNNNELNSKEIVEKRLTNMIDKKEKVNKSCEQSFDFIFG